MRRWRTEGERETRELGERLAEELLPARALLLTGDLGAGKTVLAQGVARGLGCDAREVQSPTFTLLREHGGAKARLLHFDLYRLSAREVEASGFEELLLGPGVKVVEWAERLPFSVPGALRLEVGKGPGNVRRIEELDGDDGLADQEPKKEREGRS